MDFQQLVATHQTLESLQAAQATLLQQAWYDLCSEVQRHAKPTHCPVCQKELHWELIIESACMSVAKCCGEPLHHYGGECYRVNGFETLAEYEANRIEVEEYLWEEILKTFGNRLPESCCGVHLDFAEVFEGVMGSYCKVCGQPYRCEVTA